MASDANTSPFMRLILLTLVVTISGVVLGLAACAGEVVVEWASWLLVLPSRRPGSLTSQITFATDPESPERQLGEPIETVAADGARLAGLWHPAAHPGGRRRGAVFFLHGLAEDPSGLRARMDALTAHGWDVAALDARAHGRSEGDRGSFGARESLDVSSWIDGLAASGRLGPVDDPEPIAVWGRSMGSGIALRASLRDQRIIALVLEAPYVDLAATLTRILRRKRIPSPRLFAARILRRARRLSGVSLASPRPLDLAAQATVPVLILHGERDRLIPMSDARRLAKAFPTPAELIEVSEAGHHNVVDVGGPPLLDQAACFLDEVYSRRSATVEV